MDAKKCDRCGKFYMLEDGDEEDFNVIQFTLDDGEDKVYKGSYNGRNFYELCPKCCAELKAFFDNRIDS